MAVNIISVASYLPKKIISNEEIESRLNIEKGWIYQRTGIKQRHHMANENFIDCCQKAAQTAIHQAGLVNEDIDLIVLATTTPHQIMPSSAILLQKSLGIQHCMSFDFQAACNGFIYALILAESLMTSKKINHALVLGCDAFSSVVNQNDPITACLFGDGFGAVILSQQHNNESRGIFYTNVGSDTDGVEHLSIPWGIAQGCDMDNRNNFFVSMNGREVFKNAVHRVSDEIQTAFQHNNLLIDDISCIIPHQANSRIIQAVFDHLNLPIEKCQLSLPMHGNTSAASIPLALHDWIQSKSHAHLKKDIVMLTGFGAGYTWGTVLCEF